MFGLWKNRKLKQEEEALDRSLIEFDRLCFKSAVIEMRKASGFPDTKLSLEDCIAQFSISIADIVFQSAKNSQTPEMEATDVEKAAVLIISTQVVHCSIRYCSLSDIDKDNKITLLTQGSLKLFPDESERLNILGISSKQYKYLSNNHIDLLTQVDNLISTCIVSINNNTDMTETISQLVECWKQIVVIIDS